MARQPKSASRRRRTARSRRGAAAVEFACIAIPLFLFLFTLLEFARAFMFADSLEEAARTGCREAIVKGATLEEVTSEVDRVLDLAGISSYSVEISPPELNAVSQWEGVTVRITASFDEATWLPWSKFFENKDFTASCTLPREADEESQLY
jgi:Flp pilus assembly protein TadG